jgi:hypothetical protein
MTPESLMNPLVKTAIDALQRGDKAMWNSLSRLMPNYSMMTICEVYASLLNGSADLPRTGATLCGDYGHGEARHQARRSAAANPRMRSVVYNS